MEIKGSPKTIETRCNHIILLYIPLLGNGTESNLNGYRAMRVKELRGGGGWHSGYLHAGLVESTKNLSGEKDVHNENQKKWTSRAIVFWLKRGFRLTCPFFLGGGGGDTLCMTLSAGQASCLTCRSQSGVLWIPNFFFQLKWANQVTGMKARFKELMYSNQS